MISSPEKEEEGKEEGDKQGTHELELHYGGELDLHQHVRCDKNPGHVDFIPVTSSNRYHSLEFNTFDTDNLNRFYSRAAKLTTKIKVQRVSLNRSKVKQRNRNIVLSHLAGQRITSYGSGYVTDIDVTGDQGSFPCPLGNCPHSIKPHPVYGYIIITTAAHVVFDDDEAEETIVEFFDNDPKDKRNVETANGLKIRHFSVEGDFCELMCVTHSQSLFGEISQLLKNSFVPLEEEEAPLPLSTPKRFRSTYLYPSALSDTEKSSFTRIRLVCSHFLPLMCETEQHLYSKLSDILHRQHKNVSSHQSLFSKARVFLSDAEFVGGVEGCSYKALTFLRLKRNEGSWNKFLNTHVETVIERLVLTLVMFFILPEDFITRLFSDTEDIDTVIPSNMYFHGHYLHHTEITVKDAKMPSYRLQNPLTRFSFRKIGLMEERLSAIKNILEKIENYQLMKIDFQPTTVSTRTMDLLFSCLSSLKKAKDEISRGWNGLQNVEANCPFSVKERYLRLFKLWIKNVGEPGEYKFFLNTARLRVAICALKIINKNFQERLEVAPAPYHWVLEDALKYLDKALNCIKSLEHAICNASTEVPQQQSGDSLVIHFSHPHGQSKQVTFGEHFSCDTSTGHYNHIYTVPTCNGCSGGPVWILPKGENGKILWGQVYGVPHGGCHDRGNKLNHSSSWTFIPHFLKTVKCNTAEQERKLRFKSADETKDETRNSKASSSPSVPLSLQSGSLDTIHLDHRNLTPEEKKRWLNYLLNTSADKLPPNMSITHAIRLKQRGGKNYRICDDDDMEALLSLACQYRL